MYQDLGEKYGPSVMILVSGAIVLFELRESI